MRNNASFRICSKSVRWDIQPIAITLALNWHDGRLRSSRTAAFRYHARRHLLRSRIFHIVMTMSRVRRRHTRIAGNFNRFQLLPCQLDSSWANQHNPPLTAQSVQSMPQRPSSPLMLAWALQSPRPATSCRQYWEGLAHPSLCLSSPSGCYLDYRVSTSLSSHPSAVCVRSWLESNQLKTRHVFLASTASI